MAIHVNIMVSEKVTSKLNERTLNKILKVALKEALLFWHRKHQHRNFGYQVKYRVGVGLLTRGQRFDRQGGPLFTSGTLKDRVTANKTKADVPGTSRKAKLKVRYGRPPEYTEEVLEKAIFAIMQIFDGTDYKTAQSMAYRDASYFANVPYLPEDMQQVMATITPRELEEIKEFIRDYVVFVEKNINIVRRKRVS